MFVIELVQWWYFRGWGVYLTGLKNKLGDAIDFFSIGQLFRTLFMPYRQISAGADDASGKANTFLDRLISRVVGFFTRLFIIIFGGLLIILEAIIGIILAIIWPFVPILPIFCIALTVMGIHL